MKKLSLRDVLFVAALVAMEVVLSRFLSISTATIKIGFGFVPLAVCGVLYGPVWGALAGGLADFLGAVLFPIGPYFPGFTLTAMLSGLVFGLLLSGQRPKFFPHICMTTALNCVALSFGLNSLWINILYGTAFSILLPTRAVQCGILIAVYLILIPLILMLCDRLKKIYFEKR